MDRLTIEQLDKSLTEVRKAYRILYLYQKRIIDLAKFIGDYFGYNFSGGWPKFSSPSPRRGRGSLNDWAWDWLNMYFYEFHMGECPDNDGVRFSIFVQSDTGFFDSTNIEKTDIDSFKSVGESKTRLILICGLKEWDPEELLKDEVINSNNSEFSILENKMIGKAYDLSLFIDEESTKCQLNDFKSFCRKKGIEIQVETDNK